MTLLISIYLRTNSCIIEGYVVWKTRDKEGRDPACLPVPKIKKPTKRKHTKEVCSVWAENFPRATKAHIFIIKKCGWKNQEKNKNNMSVSCLKIPAGSLQDMEEKMMENTVKNLIVATIERENNHVSSVRH